MRRRAFTLFEIAISLAILTVAVLSVTLIFPTGIKAQQLARHKIHGVALCLNLVDAWTQTVTMNANRQLESQYLFNNPHVQRSREDIERALMEYSLRPLPSQIALRLDSDNDEIQTIINRGGRLYYPTASPYTPQSLLIAVDGYPQLNVLSNHPCLAWPYYDHVPGPPHTWERDNWKINTAT
jgi:hypothetical protein